MIKTIGPIDSAKILSAYNEIESGIQWTESGHKGRQTGLQYSEGNDPWTDAVGKHRGIVENNYNLLNPYYKNTVFEELIIEYKLYRTRLMWVGPFAAYSMHQDSSHRLHIPMVTNLDCYFVFKKGIVQHLPLNSVYLVDTRYHHTFMNASADSRLHLVGVIDGSARFV